MGSLVQLIIAGVMLATVLGGIYAAWSSFKDHIGKPYAEAQRVADQAVVDKANRAQQVAESERDNAKADTASCKAASEKQSSEVVRLGNLASANIAAAREARAQAQREASAAAPRIADLQAKAAAAPKLESCEIELGKAKDVLRESLRVRRTLPAPTK